LAWQFAKPITVPPIETQIILLFSVIDIDPPSSAKELECPDITRDSHVSRAGLVFVCHYVKSNAQPLFNYIQGFHIIKNLTPQCDLLDSIYMLLWALLAGAAAAAIGAFSICTLSHCQPSTCCTAHFFRGKDRALLWSWSPTYLTDVPSSFVAAHLTSAISFRAAQQETQPYLSTPVSSKGYGLGWSRSSEFSPHGLDRAIAEIGRLMDATYHACSQLAADRHSTRLRCMMPLYLLY
jgi:hypothetical protein